MFGGWRLLLALEVVAQHLLFVPFIGFYAVFSFFVLSGFLMTHVMQSRYGYTTRGVAHFLANRALRLFPAYWLALLVGIALILWFGAGPVAEENGALRLPATTASWVQNATMIFADWMPRRVEPRLVPLAWALTVEIAFYALIALGLSRTPVRTLAWLGASLLYVPWIRHLHPEGGDYLYNSIPAASLPFACGALAWHARGPIARLGRRIGPAAPLLPLAGRWLLYGAVLALLETTGWRWPVMAGNWVNILLSCMACCLLMEARPAAGAAGADQALGDYSYPIYLFHIQMGAMAALLVSDPILRVAAALSLTFIAATICIRLIDPVADRLRSRLRGTAR